LSRIKFGDHTINPEIGITNPGVHAIEETHVLFGLSISGLTLSPPRGNRSVTGKIPDIKCVTCDYRLPAFYPGRVPAVPGG
jgi:hypothetical protein